MADFVMLVCASVASMGFGILAAYWILRAGFALTVRVGRHTALP